MTELDAYVLAISIVTAVLGGWLFRLFIVRRSRRHARIFETDSYSLLEVLKRRKR